MASSSSSELSSTDSQRDSPPASALADLDLAQHPSVDLTAGIEAKDKQVCLELLHEYPDTLTEPGSAFEWLKDPIVIGLTPTEIVSLLIEESEQSPWICYEMIPPDEKDTIDYTLDYIQTVEFIQNLAAEFKRKISELCGLGGIIPTPNDRASWAENAIVWSFDRSATISYKPISQAVGDSQWMEAIFEHCLSALDRLARLFQWLQSHAVLRDYFVTFSINRENQVEAVRVPLHHITRLRQCLVGIIASGADESSADRNRALSATTVDILRLFFRSYRESASLGETVDDCALAVQALCVAMLSFSQAHIGEIDPFFLEFPLEEIRLRAADLPGGVIDEDLYFGLVKLTCAGDMIDSKVMAFAMRTVEAHETFDLCITLADLTILWGPGTLSYYPFPGPEAVLPGSWLGGIAFRNGVIYKPTAESSDMHWKAGAIDDIRDGVAFELDVQKKMTIGTILVKRNCPTEPGPYNTVPRKNISNEFKELGTWPERWNLREQQVGLQGGQFLNATFNATWIKSDSRTRKQKGLEEVNLDFLNQPWGLFLSVCTGVAQRVALREVVAEVMSQMTDGWLEKPLEWQTLMSMGEGLFEELKKPTFPTWVKKLDIVAQHALIRSISYVLHKICWTGVNRAGKLVVACPQSGNSDACIYVSLKGSRGFMWLFRDTERSATFACLTNTCFVVAPWFDDCQDNPHPQWQNQVPGLITSVCQYQWLGADDWAKLPQTELRNEGVYWISTGEDRRRVTAKTSSGSPARLTISESTIHWRFFRRAWERVERIRKDTLVELRERSLMTEDCAQDVVIVRD